MKELLINFRNNLLELILAHLWNQWSTLGVSGYSEGKKTFIIDPEALLVFTASIGKYDGRLFDEVLDWTLKNNQLINIQRIKTILNAYPFPSASVLSAIAEKLLYLKAGNSKWRLLSTLYAKNDSEPLFYSKTHIPLPLDENKLDESFLKHGYKRSILKLRGNTVNFNPATPNSLLLKLRSMFGLNVRCEILSFLIDGRCEHPSEISKHIFYSQKTVQDALVAMASTDTVVVMKKGREKKYSLCLDKWKPLLSADNPIWHNWVPLYFAIENIYLTINRLLEMNLSELAFISEIRELSLSTKPILEKASYTIGELEFCPNKDFFYMFSEKIINILKGLN
ncbi:MAG: hypothetical protein WCR55_02460 [Lentisphaerota bacterium]